MSTLVSKKLTLVLILLVLLTGCWGLIAPVASTKGPAAFVCNPVFNDQYTIDCGIAISPLNLNQVANTSWDFGDSTDIVTEKFPRHTFKTDGYYVITFTVEYNDGIKYSSSAPVKVAGN